MLPPTKHYSGVIREKANESNASGPQENNLEYCAKAVNQESKMDIFFFIIFLYKEKMSIFREQRTLH